MKTLIVIGILLVALTGVAQAAQPIFSGPVGFNIVTTDQQKTDNVRKLVNSTTAFDGTITVDPSSADPSGKFPNIKMEGTLSDGTSVTISCSWEDMGTASAKGDNSTKNVNDKFLLVACCGFTAVDPSGTTTGVAFLNLAGTLIRPKGWTNDFPQSIKITGSKINGGGTGFVFNGTFSSSLTPE